MNTVPQCSFYNTATKTGKNSLTSFIFPTSATNVDMYAFRGCGLISVTLPSAITSIKHGAFLSCKSLASVSLPSSVTYIDNWAFGDCTNLKNISIPSSVSALGDAAFANSGLNSIVLPNGLKSIGSWAFQMCPSLVSISIPASVNHIGYYAFVYNNSLAKFVVASDNPNYSSVDGVLFDKNQQKLLSYPVARNSVYQIPVGVNVVDTAAFEGAWGMKSIVIPTTVTTLSSEAFYECVNLKSIDIPASVTSIGSYGFYRCSGLSTITVHGSPVSLSASDSVFKYVDQNACTLYVPSGTKAAYQAAAQWKDFSNIVEINSKTINVSAGGFYAALTSIELNTTTNLKITGTIDARDFKTMRDNMPLLIDLDLSGVIIQTYSGTEGPNDGYTIYAANAIPNHAFYTQSTNMGRKSLQTILLPQTLTTIEVAAFASCGLTEISLPNGISSVQDWAFAGNNLSSVTIPATLSSIGLCTFTYNNALSSFQVSGENPYMMTNDGVLFDKSQKTILCYPNGRSGHVYEIPSGVSVVDKSAFAGWCLEKVIIPTTVNSLNKYAFYQCESLKTIEIPASVNFIGESAFASCTALTSISMDTTNPIDLNSSNNVFLNVNENTCTLYVHIGSKSAYQSANQWKDFVNIVEVENSLTYNVTVPDVTKSCYIAGDMNNWSFMPMSRVDNTHYSISISGANSGMLYKYCSGPAWKYGEKAADGSDIPNRTYSSNDAVGSWASVYDPTIVLTNLTYNVTVPVGTKACYIVGDMNNWNFTAMTKIDDTHYSVTLKSSNTYVYKYCSGPLWDFVEVNVDGISNVPNRSYTTTDIVLRWLTVYDPSNIKAQKIAIVKNFDDSEIANLQSYLLFMGFNSTVFDNDGLTYDLVSGYDLLIWDDLGYQASGLSDSNVSVFNKFYQSGKPLYFIGDDLAYSSINLSQESATVWKNLIHLSGENNFSQEYTVNIANVTHPVIDGIYGKAKNFDYNLDIDFATQTNTGELVLAKTLDSDVLLVYDGMYARTVTQNCLVVQAGSDSSISERKKIFRNAVCQQRWWG